MRARGAALVVCIGVVALVGAACSGDDDTARPTTTSTTTSHAGAPDLTLVDLNVLHGAACTDGQHCDAPDRVALIAREIEAAHCPDVVTFEEVAPWMHDLLVTRRPTLCGGAYKLLFPKLADYLDVEAVLTKLPAHAEQRFTLAGGARRALRVALDTPIGPVDVIVTHAGTGADDFGNGGIPCAPSGAGSCPPPCKPTGPAFDCQIRQLVDLADPAHASTRAATLVVGDLNLVARSRPMQLLFDHGFVDTYRAARNPECVPATGAGCTSGKVDTDIAVLRDPNSRESVRVDYVLLERGTCVPVYDPTRDLDHDGVGTGLWAATPAKNGPGGLAFASDHVGVALDLRCR